MAPRPPESFEAFLSRLQEAITNGGTQVRFGKNHHSHAVCVEEGVFRVRRLEVTPEEAKAYLDEHGIFMPEHSEMISKPRTLVFEEPTLEALTAVLEKHWPL
jgi:hypothetical protein